MEEKDDNVVSMDSYRNRKTGKLVPFAPITQPHERVGKLAKAFEKWGSHKGRQHRKEKDND